MRYTRRLRIGAALQLGFVRLTGTTLDALDYVPRSVLGSCGKTARLACSEVSDLKGHVSAGAHAVRASSLGLRARGISLGPDGSDIEGLRNSLMTFGHVTLDRSRLARHAREFL
jgi:hypothetical protein